MKIAVLSSGGDAPGMNSAIKVVVKTSLGRGHDIIGVNRGYEGLIESDFVKLDLNSVDAISNQGGTILGAARSKTFQTSDGRKKANQVLIDNKIECLIVIGGNGSLTGAYELSKISQCKIVGIPASIDNDIGHCGMAIGVDTAVNTIVEACDRISDTARAHRRAFIVEVMGRHCGYLAMRAGIAADADAILFAEKKVSEVEVLDKLKQLLKQSFSDSRKKKRVLIIKAEGVSASTQNMVKNLQEFLDEEIPGIGIRETILGHVVRGGNPSSADRVIAKRLALSSIMALEDDKTCVMCSWDPPFNFGEKTQDPNINLVHLEDMINETKHLVDGTSKLTKFRVKMLNWAEDLFAL
jgi:6-phosphofructokinase 1